MIAMNHNYSQTTDMRSETPKTEHPSRRPRARSRPHDNPIIGHAIPVILRPLTILSLRGNDHHTITHS